MGDRTTVCITAPAWVDKAIAEDLYDEKTVNDDGTVTYEEYGCNYGDSELEYHLDKLEVGYDKSWERGDDYGGGQSWVRFNAGEREEITISEEDRIELGDLVVDSVFNNESPETLAIKVRETMRERKILAVTVDVKDISPQKTELEEEES